MSEAHDTPPQPKTPEKGEETTSRVAAVLRMVTDGVRRAARFWSGADLTPEERRSAALESVRMHRMHPS